MRVSVTSLPKCTPGVKLALKALHIGQEVDDVHVSKVLLEGNGSCAAATLGLAVQQVPILPGKSGDCAHVVGESFQCRTSNFCSLGIQQAKIVGTTRIGGQQITLKHTQVRQPRLSELWCRKQQSLNMSTEPAMVLKYLTAARLDQVQMAVPTR